MGSVTARISDENSQRLEQLSAATRRSKSWLVAEAVQKYLDEQAWQIERTLESIKQADAGEFATHEEIKEAFAEGGVDIDAV